MQCLGMALLAAACGDAGAPVVDTAAYRGPASPEASQGTVAQGASADQRLIRSGDLQIEVHDVESAVQHADSVAQSNGGLVTDARTLEDGNGNRQARLSLRVPADHFDETMRSLKTLGDTKSEAASQQDITKAYLDLETRLAVKEQAIERLRRLLAERTGSLSDVLDVERELSRVLTEIEQMKGERRYYDDQVALATIAVTLFEPGALRAPATMSIGIALRQAVQLLDTSVGWLLYLTTFLAPWLAVTAGVWWLARAIRRRRGA